MLAEMLGGFALMSPRPLYCTSHFNNFSDNEGHTMLIFKCWAMWYLDIRERKPFLLTHRKWTCTNRKLFSSKKGKTKQPHKHRPSPGFSPVNNKKWQVLCFIYREGEAVNVVLLSEWKTEYGWKMLTFHPPLMNKNDTVTFLKHS